MSRVFFCEGEFLLEYLVDRVIALGVGLGGERERGRGWIIGLVGCFIIVS